jgi:hypothetical protein
LSGLRAAYDFAAHNQARFRRGPERVQMQAVRLLDDRARKLDKTTIVDGRWREGRRGSEKRRRETTRVTRTVATI